MPVEVYCGCTQCEYNKDELCHASYVCVSNIGDCLCCCPIEEQKAKKVEQFKPCPFCGKTKPLRVIEHRNGYVSVMCDVIYNGCGATGSSGITEKNAIELWNRRVDNEKDTF